MAYDEAFAQRVRHVLEGEEGISEKAMFGGLAFLVDGHLALAVSGRDQLMIRADVETEQRLLQRDGIGQTVMRGRPMSGWLDVDGTVVAADDSLDEPGGPSELDELVKGAVAYARTLPPKA